MKLVRTVPGVGGLAELLSFYCTRCGEARTIERAKNFQDRVILRWISKIEWPSSREAEPLHLRRGLIAPRLTDQRQYVAAHQLMGESLNAPHSAAAAQTLVSADGGKAEKMTPAQRNTRARRLARLGSRRARLQKGRPVAVVH